MRITILALGSRGDVQPLMALAIASDHGIHPNQVSQWKKQLLEEGPTVFINGRSRQQREQEA